MTTSLKWKCDHCSELNRDQTTACWICQRPRAEDNEATYEEEELPRTARSEVMTAVLGIAMATICCSTVFAAPGLGILLSSTLIFPLLRTALVMARRKGNEGNTSFAALLLLFLSSMAVTWIILAVVGVAALGTFCFTCMGVYDLTDDEGLSYLVSGSLATLVTGLLGFLFFKWVRRRWRRDMGQR